MKIINSYVENGKVYTQDDIQIEDNVVVIGVTPDSTAKYSSVTFIPDDGIIVTILVDIASCMQDPFDVISMSISAIMQTLLIQLDVALFQANGIGGSYAGTLQATMKAALDATEKATAMAKQTITDTPTSEGTPLPELPVPSVEEIKQMGKDARQQLVESAKSMVDTAKSDLDQIIQKGQSLIKTVKSLYEVKQNPEAKASQIANDLKKSVIVQSKTYYRKLSANFKEAERQETLTATTEEIV